MRAAVTLSAILLLGGCQAFRSAFPRGGKDQGVAERANRAARDKDLGIAERDRLREPKGAFDKGKAKLEDALAKTKERLGKADAPRALGDGPLAAVADRGAGPLGGAAGDGSTVATSAKYAAFRDRLDALGATWSSEKSADGRRTLVKCEVPYPGDAAHARVFESSSADELAALTAAVTQAERWHATAKTAPAGKNLAEPPAP